MNRLHLFLLAGLLALLGLGISCYKAVVLNFPLSDSTATQLWAVEARLHFKTNGQPAKVSLNIPHNTARYLIMDENYISQGWGLTTALLDGNRLSTWAKRRPVGGYDLYYRALIRPIEHSEPATKLKAPELGEHNFEGAELVAAQAILTEARAQSTDAITLAGAILQMLGQQTSRHEVRVLLGRQPSQLRRVKLAARLLLLGQVPARVVHGLSLVDQVRHAKLISWLEIFDSKAWHGFDPITEQPGLADNYLVWWRGFDPLVTSKGVTELSTTISIESQPEEAVKGAVIGARQTDPWVVRFSLFQLPVQTQLVYRILLLVPLGAFLVALFRNFIGIKTFGTFMPVLIALAFRETSLVTGLILFTSIVSLGLLFRFYFEHLHLLLVPRLAAVLTVVVILMVGTSVLTSHLGLTSGLSVALFPMVIMTMTIERMSIVWEELGGLPAIRQGVGTLAIASIVYLIITYRPIEHIIFIFPELLLVILAATLLLGRYKGYRLVELIRFRALGKEA